MEWSAGAHPLEQKKALPNDLTLLRFEPGFADPNWCHHSHVFFVLQGTLHLEFEDGEVAVDAGQAMWLDEGTAHRASVRGGSAVLLFAASNLKRS